MYYDQSLISDLRHRLILYPLFGAVAAVLTTVAFSLLVTTGSHSWSVDLIKAMKFPFVTAAIASSLTLAEFIYKGNTPYVLHRLALSLVIAFAAAYIPAIPVRYLFLAPTGTWASSISADFSINLSIWVMRSISWGIVFISVGIGSYFTIKDHPGFLSCLLAGFSGGALGGLLFDPLILGQFGSVLSESTVAQGLSMGMSGCLAGFFLASLISVKDRPAAMDSEDRQRPCSS